MVSAGAGQGFGKHTPAGGLKMPKEHTCVSDAVMVYPLAHLGVQEAPLTVDVLHPPCHRNHLHPREEEENPFRVCCNMSRVTS